MQETEGVFLSHNTLCVCPGASPMELERYCQQECEAGMGSFVSSCGLANRVPLSYLIAQCWFLHVKKQGQ